MNRTRSLDFSSSETDIFVVKRSTEADNPASNNTPVVPNSTELFGAQEKEVIKLSSVAFPEPKFVTSESDSNEPTIRIWASTTDYSPESH